MNARIIGTACVVLLWAAAAVMAQPGEGIVYVGGLAHAPLGVAVFGPVDGRRLPVSNIGSSGQDGVEIQYRTAFGLGSGVEIGPLLATTATVHAAFKGWDGTIKGNVYFACHGNGSATCTADFPGASTIQYKFLNALGQVITTGTFPPGGVDFVNNIPCPDGSFATWGPVVHETDLGQTYVTMEVGCWGSISMGGTDARVLVLTPGLPPGTPVWDFQSMSLTATGVTQFTVADAAVRTFNVASYGVGTAVLEPEDCIGFPPPCAQGQRRLPVRNIGSSGQDLGIAVDLGSGASGGSMARSKQCPDCPPGHVTLIKFSDDSDQRTMGASHADDPATGQVVLTVDSTSVGSGQTLATLRSLDGAAMVQYPLTTLDALTYSPCLPAPPSSSDVWSFGPNRYTFRQTCPFVVSLPSGIVLAGVGSIDFQPVNPTAVRAPSRVRVTTDDPAGFNLDGVSVTPWCAADVNRDFQVTPTDIAVFVNTWFDSLVHGTLVGDFDGNQVVQPADIATFVGVWFSALTNGC